MGKGALDLTRSFAVVRDANTLGGSPQHNTPTASLLEVRRSGRNPFFRLRTGFEQPKHGNPMPKPPASRTGSHGGVTASIDPVEQMKMSRENEAGG